MHLFHLFVHNQVLLYSICDFFVQGMTPKKVMLIFCPL